MEKINENQLTDVLKDVRKAYRLLYLFQKRILDTVSFIGTKYGFDKIERGYSKFSKRAPAIMAVDDKKWAWDWLNMYLYEFHFGAKDNDENKIYFSIILQSDTGFWDGKSNDKLDLETYADVEESSSRLIFIAGRDAFGCPLEILLKEELGKDKSEYFIPGKPYYAKAYNIKDFLNEESTQKKIEDFNEQCMDHHIGNFLNNTIVERQDNK